MPLRIYGVLKGRPIGRRLAVASSGHYQIHLITDHEDFRIAVNVKSQLPPSDLEYLIDPDFQHPLAAGLLSLPVGFHELHRQPGGLALDFIRANLFDRTRLRPLPFDVPGLNNDLNEELDRYVQPALADEAALMYAFGERWGPETKPDPFFGFRPGNGIHDLHMNQSNVGSFVEQDGVWQDGALLIHFPGERRWVGIFLKFQSQTWHSDDRTGHRIEPVGEPDLTIRIVAALVNPRGPDPLSESVTLLNTTPERIDLRGWAIADQLKNKHRLGGTLNPGQTIKVPLDPPVQLSNSGGIITLLNAQGLKVHGVSYTQRQAEREGWTLAF